MKFVLPPASKASLAPAGWFVAYLGESDKLVDTSLHIASQHKKQKQKTKPRSSTMAAESAFVAIPLGHEQPPPHTDTRNKGYKELLVLVAITAVLLLCQIHQQVFFVDRKQDSSIPQVIKWEKASVINVEHPYDPYRYVESDDFDDADDDSILSTDIEEPYKGSHNNKVNRVVEPVTSSVVTLTDDSFDNFIQEHEAVFVDFYAPWCTWCQRLAPTWTKFASEASNLPMVVATIDCVEHANTCRKEKMMAFPTLRWYRNGEPVPPDYKMDRTVDALIKHSKTMLNIIEDNDHDSSGSNQEVTVQEEGESEEEEISPEELSDSSDESSDLFDIDIASEEEEEDEESDPYVEIEDFDNDDDSIYATDFDYDHDNTLTTYKKPVTSSEHPSKAIVTLTDDTFESFVQAHKAVYVAFIVPCTLCDVTKRIEDTWTHFASAAPPQLAVAKVDCEESLVTCRKQGIRGLRTLRWYQNGETVDYSSNIEPTVNQLVAFSKIRLAPVIISPPGLPDSFDEYSDEEEEEEEDRGLFAHTMMQQSPSEDYPQEAVEESQEDSKDPIHPNEGRPCKEPADETIFQSSYTTSLTNVTFQDFLKDQELVFVDFYAPWCVWSQRMAPSWNAFAASMRDEPAIRIAQVNCVAFRDLCHQQGILAFPTLRLYRQGYAMISDYKMNRTVSAFTTYVNKYMRVEKVEIQDSDIEDSEDPIIDEEWEDSERLVVPKVMTPIARSSTDNEASHNDDLEDYVEEKDFGVQLPRWVTTLW